MRKESKEDEQTLEEFNSAPRRLQATELSRPSVWENLDLGRVYRPHCVRSVLTTSVKILPYRPPARLIRAKYGPRTRLVRGIDSRSLSILFISKIYSVACIRHSNIHYFIEFFLVALFLYQISPVCTKSCVLKFSHNRYWFK